MIVYGMQDTKSIDNSSNQAAVDPDVEARATDAGLDKDSVLYKSVVRIQSRYRGYAVRKVGICAERNVVIHRGHTWEDAKHFSLEPWNY